MFEEYRYFDTEGDLQSQGTIMINRGFAKGLFFEFDKQGNIIKQTDYDKPFTYSWKQLYNFIKTKGIDLYDTHTYVKRDASDQQNPYWLITWKHEILPAVNVLIISGIDGEFLEQKTDYFEK